MSNLTQALETFFGDWNKVNPILRQFETNISSDQYRLWICEIADGKYELERLNDDLLITLICNLDYSFSMETKGFPVWDSMVQVHKLLITELYKRDLFSIQKVLMLRENENNEKE